MKLEFPFSKWTFLISLPTNKSFCELPWSMYSFLYGCNCSLQVVGSLSYSLKLFMLLLSLFTVFVSLCRFQAYPKKDFVFWKISKKGLFVEKRLPTLMSLFDWFQSKWQKLRKFNCYVVRRFGRRARLQPLRPHIDRPTSIGLMWREKWGLKKSGHLAAWLIQQIMKISMNITRSLRHCWLSARLRLPFYLFILDIHVWDYLDSQ